MLKDKALAIVLSTVESWLMKRSRDILSKLQGKKRDIDILLDRHLHAKIILEWRVDVVTGTPRTRGLAIFFSRTLDYKH